MAGLVSNVYSLTPGKKRKSNGRQAQPSRITKADIYRQKLIERATPSEIAFQHILVDLRIQYEFQRPFKKRNHSTVFADFYLPHQHVIVEIDGGYHNNPVQEWKDQQRTVSILKKNGKVKQILRFTNDQVLNDPESVKQRIREEFLS